MELHIVIRRVPEIVCVIINSIPLIIWTVNKNKVQVSVFPSSCMFALLTFDRLNMPFSELLFTIDGGDAFSFT